MGDGALRASRRKVSAKVIRRSAIRPRSGSPPCQRACAGRSPGMTARPAGLLLEVRPGVESVIPPPTQRRSALDARSAALGSRESTGLTRARGGPVDDEARSRISDRLGRFLKPPPVECRNVGVLA